jgi:hypothetical protein
MRIISGLSSYVSRVMVKMGALPGLGFLQNYVFAARAVKSKFGDHVEDYQVFLSAGQDAIKEVKPGGDTSRGPGGPVEATETAETDVYDDYEWGDTSAAYHPVDDYPSSDDLHHYYDDDYRTN